MAQGKELIKMINHIVTGPNECAFWRLGQMGFVLKITNKTIYIDPFLSDDGLRIIPSVLKPEEVTNADIVIGDIVTGSYHLTELEALSMGKPSLMYTIGLPTFLKGLYFAFHICK